MLRTKIFFTLLFFLISFFIFFALNHEKDEKIEKYLKQKTTFYTQSYNVIYDQYKNLSRIIFDIEVNKPAVLKIIAEINKTNKDQQRDKLYAKLKDIYAMLQQYNLKQLHFHLTNNESFLRFHRPKKHGDSLLGVRQTVAYVNQYQKFIDGFEEGRIYNGYRFVYPLFYQNKHIGSVEISFSTHAMSANITQKYDLPSYFLIKKEVVEKKLFQSEKHNYTNSNLQKFYIENNIFNYMNNISNQNTLDHISKELEQKIYTLADSKRKAFSIYNKEDKNLLTFIKVNNAVTQKNIGLFVIASDSSYIDNKKNNFYYALLLSSLLLFILMLFIYTELVHRVTVNALYDKIEKLNNKLLTCVKKH
jgi:two-component system, sensor histidine kinase and response regulator